MPPRRTRLKIPGLCAEGPPSYSEAEMYHGHRLLQEKALAQVSQDATYCVHYSSLQEILNSQALADRIARYPEGDRTHIEYIHQVPADTPQDPRNLWLRKQDPKTGAVTVTSAAEDPWDRDVILFLPDGASPVDPGPSLLDIYTAMVIGHRARDRDLSDEEALERCQPDVRTAITYVLGRIETTGASLDEETKHRLTMARLRGMPVEMLDRAYNLYRLEHHCINLDDHPEYRSYQTFYELGIAPPTHQEMADIIIQAVATSMAPD